jgi:hypothetical protein
MVMVPGRRQIIIFQAPEAFSRIGTAQLPARIRTFIIGHESKEKMTQQMSGISSLHAQIGEGMDTKLRSPAFKSNWP